MRAIVSQTNLYEHLILLHENNKQADQAAH